MDNIIAAGSTSVLIEVVMRGTADGQPLTGLAVGAVTVSYHRDGAAAAVALGAPAVLAALGTWETDAWKETAITGVYQYGIPNAALITGARGVTFIFTGTAAITKEYRIVFPDHVADAVWDEVLTKATHNIVTSGGRRLRQLGAVNILDGTTTAGTVQSITLDSDASTTANIYNQNLIAIIAGTGAGQSRMIIEYSAGRVAVVDDPWDVVPSTDSEYQILAFSGIVLATHGTAQAGAASTITLATSALATANSYVGSLVYLASGTGAGQTRLITAYTTGRVATVEPAWETAPDNTTIYKIIPVGRAIPSNATATTDAFTAIKGATFDTATDSLEAVRNRGDAAWITEVVTDDKIAIDHNTGGTDTLRYTTALGVAIADADIRAYTTAEYEAGAFTLRGKTTTTATGRWLTPLYLDDGVPYTIVFEKSGEYGPNTAEVTP